jgi:hypothetical protein
MQDCRRMSQTKWSAPVSRFYSGTRERERESERASERGRGRGEASETSREQSIA